MDPEIDATPKDKPAMPLLISELRNFKEVARAEYGKTSYLSGGGLFCGRNTLAGPLDCCRRQAGDDTARRLTDASS